MAMNQFHPNAFSIPSGIVYHSQLPAGWDAKRDERSGRIYFVNHLTKSTTWEDPRPLPQGWATGVDPNTNMRYFTDHNNRRNQWEDPRPPITLRSSSGKMSSEKTPEEIVRDGRTFILHREMESSSRVEVFVQQNSLCFTPVGQRQNIHTSMSISSIKALILGKQAVVFQEKASLSAANQCFSIVTTSRETFVKGLKALNPNLDIKEQVKASSYNKPPPQQGDILPADDSDVDTTSKKWYLDLLHVCGLTNKKLTVEQVAYLKSARGRLKLSDGDHDTLSKKAGFNADATEDVAGDDDGAQDCCICLEFPADHIILPCFHVCLCENDAELIMNSKDPKCPKCRTTAEKIHKVYY
jgi:hypothetical protein